MFLEGIRISSGANPLTYPPRSLVVDQNVLNNSQSLGRAEYMIYVSGQSPGATGIEIADPNLVFFWSRNDAITRFDFDAYSRRWNSLPGGPPDQVGAFGNSPRLIVPVPNLSQLSVAPYAIYIGTPTRLVTFTMQIVETAADFTDPPAGTVQISLDKGELNFGSVDLANVTYQSSIVQLVRQNFDNRTKSKGIFGTLPASSSESYNLFINPIPGPGQIPRIRIGYRTYLKAIAVPNESSLFAPPSGSVVFSLDTGKTLFATADISSFPSSNVYYDGVTLSSFALTRVQFGTTSKDFPTPSGHVAIFMDPNLDPTRYIIYAEAAPGGRYYFATQIVNSSTSSLSSPPQGTCLVDIATGNVYIGTDDLLNLNGAAMFYVDTVANIERGVAVQFYRSGANAAGYENTPDFTEQYLVINQIVQNGITGSPFVSLPTQPLVNSSLIVSVQPAVGGGTFVGDLVDSTDPTQQALGYFLDLDNKQLKFTNRTTINTTLDKATSMVKLNNSAISSAGIQVSKNGNALQPGVDFLFDPNGGLMEFTTPVGEDDPANILNIAGQVIDTTHFVTSKDTFTAGNVGKFLFISLGPNVGLRQITGFVSPKEIVVGTPFVSVRNDTADIRATREIIADRFFTPFVPPLKTFSIQKGLSTTGPFVTLDQSQFTVFQTTGQINLVTPTNPGDVFQISYIWQNSPDNGVTVTPTNVTELAAFKIRQETCTTQVNSGIATFNPTGKTVNVSKGITLYIDGVSQNPTSFTFQAPGTLTTNQIFTSANNVVVDYYVAESPGGNSSFTLVNSPISVDYPKITSGQNSAVFNGNQTVLLSQGSALLYNDNIILIVQTVVYDSSIDVTNVTFTTTPQTDSNTTSQFKVSASITGDYMLKETSAHNTVSKGSSLIVISGQASGYSQGTIVTLDGDPYLVSSSLYDPTKNVTSVTLASNALRNYIIFALYRTIRPILQSGSNFNTAQPADLNFPFTLVRDGKTPAVLRLGIDYNVSEGGLVQLIASVGFGDILEAMYVARVTQPVGTKFKFNYAFFVAPNQNNGILGQNLAVTYNLYSPDTWFYRIETVVSFIPEVIASLKASSTSGTSGPAITSRTGLRTKDMGVPSLYFNEQHLGNLDNVVSRLLKFYNDLINNYEDILSDLDGRVVGGTSGKFRFNRTSIIVTTYNQITNDIDDKVVLYNNVTLTGFFTFVDTPVYGFMYQPNNLSRIYPTANPLVTVALNGRTAPIIDFGVTVGSTFINNLTSIGNMTTSRAVSEFDFATYPDDATALAELIALVNNIQTVYNTHVQSAIYHVTPNTSDISTSPAAFDLTSAINLVNNLVSVYNSHLTRSGVHQTNDGVNGETYPSAFDLFSAIELANDLSAKYSAHLSQKGVHGYDDVIHSSNAAKAIDLPTSITLANDLKAQFNAHLLQAPPTSGNHIIQDNVNTITDPNAIDLPTSLNLAIQLKAFFNRHIASIVYHSEADTNNTVSTADPTNLASLEAVLNAIQTAYNNHRTQILNSIHVHGTNDTVDVVTVVGPATSFSIPSNGNAKNLVPPFVAGQVVQVYNPDGSPNGLLTRVAAVTGTGPFAVSVYGVYTGLTRGGLLQDTSNTNDSNNHFYTPGRNFSTNNDDGTIHNNFLIPFFQSTMSGNELVDTPVTFVNGDTTPRRIPVLDGSTLTDNGRPSYPPLSRYSEQDYINDELGALVAVGTATVALDFLTVQNATFLPAINQEIIFLNGPNVGHVGVVQTILTPTSFKVSLATIFPINDPVGHDYYIVSQSYGDLHTIIQKELGILVNNVATTAIPPALIGLVASELINIDAAIRSYGQYQETSTGTTVGNVLTDLTVNYSTAVPPVNNSSLLYVTSGVNQGLYKIASVTNHTLTINPTSPYPAFAANAASPYILFQPWSFLSAKEFQFATQFLQSLLAFYNTTLTWSTSITLAGSPARITTLNNRITAIQSFIQTIQGLLRNDDNLYNLRYLWIQQRTDKTNGTLILETQAKTQREQATARLIANQQKLFVANLLP